jgi:16S rRNA (guanine527-N7)-methyltransferase
VRSAPTLEKALDRLGAVALALTGRVLLVETRTQFSRYAELIHLWSRTHNLTGLRSPEAIVRGLFEDSLLFLPLLPAGATRVVDIGAGAGIPGVPLHLVDPGRAVVLIEARQKRVSFLRTVKRELGFDDRIAVVEGRAERIVAEGLYAACADVVVARSVGPPAEVMAIAARYLKPGGLFIASAGPASGIHTSEGAGHRRFVELPEFSLRRAFMVQTG